jgi:bifunctional non-homologous end joining protein LigD
VLILYDSIKRRLAKLPPAEIKPPLPRKVGVRERAVIRTMPVAEARVLVEHSPPAREEAKRVRLPSCLLHCPGRVGVSRARHDKPLRRGLCAPPFALADSTPPVSAPTFPVMLPVPPSPPRSGFIEPCLPSAAERPPSGPDWIHEIKHDGYRLMARRDSVGIRLLTRNGYDWASRYPLIVEAVDRLKVRSCLIDGEAVACDENGLAVFKRLRRKPSGKHVFLYAFDLLELDGQDLRREPLETRKATLASLLRGSLPGLRLNEHLAQDGESVFQHACKMGLEGIVSKRLGSRYRSGRSKDWLKFKNPDAPAVKREAEEEWGQ